MSTVRNVKSSAFPIDIAAYTPLDLDPSKPDLDAKSLAHLRANVQLVRDTIVFFTAVAGVKGLAGHTGGAYSIVPEVLIADAFIRRGKVYPALFDEAGHRVAIQYAMAAFNGTIPFDKLYYYREPNEGMYGHPELDPKHGVAFSSGRLGHLWPFVNGVARANPDKAVLLLGSDGSQQEGNDAEAARLAVAQNLNVKIVVDDNNVTIAGHPREYLPGYDVARTLEGHGLTVLEGDGEDLADLYRRMQRAFAMQGAVAVVNRRPMAPGIPGIDGTHKGHDVIPKENAVAYLEARGLTDAIAQLNQVEVPKSKTVYRGVSADFASNRTEFGKIVNGILDKLPEADRKKTVFVIDSDLEGSTGLKAIREKHPEVFCTGGVMERGNFSAAAGFGFAHGKQGVFSTFSAFLEMIVSEITMARMNEANVLCHFSHAGVDEISDNTCHFGINVFFANNGLVQGDKTRLYFPADAAQLKSCVERVFRDDGLRFVFTNRSKLPYVLKPDGSRFFDDAYKFEPGRDDVVREGNAGYVVTYGEVLYRALDAVERAREQGIDVGLINKATLNVPDEAALKRAGAATFVLVAEGQNAETGLGVRFGTWLMERGFTPRFGRMGVTRPGIGGQAEQIPHQGLDPDSILARIQKLNR